MTRAGSPTLLFLLLAAACGSVPERRLLPPPETPRGPVVDEYHGVRVADPYRWLEDTDSPRTRAWVAAQDARARRWLSSVPGREALRGRLAELWSYERLEVPILRDGTLFYRFNRGDEDQSLLYAGGHAPAQDGRVLLDPNAESADGTYALVDVEPSPDGRLVACGSSDGGSDWRIWTVLETDGGRRLEDLVTGNKFGGVRWGACRDGFYYTRLDRPAPGEELVALSSKPDIAFHRLGTDEADDVVVVPRPTREGVTQGFEASADGRALFVLRSDAATQNNELLVVPLDPESGLAAGAPRALAAGFDAEYRYVGDDGRTAWVRTDLDAPRWRIVAIDLEDPAREGWREVVPEGEDAMREAKGFGGRLVVSYLHDACARLTVHAVDGAESRELRLPGLGTVRNLEGSWDDPVFHFDFEAFTQAPSIYRHDLSTGETTAVHVPELPFDRSGYVTRQVFYPSADGTRVPMFLTHAKGLEPDGDAPVYLFGYGGFDIPITPFFSPAHLAFLERGGILAVANLRGGGEYGVEWHEAGTKLSKQNVFDDFLAAAEWLVSEGYTRPGRLAIGGRSNGGLLVGACLTQRPELFGAALPVVGVLDMLRYHRFTIGWAWAADYGTVADPEEFEALLAYSPVHNARPARYPPTLISTGDHDDRVVPAHSYKFAAALQHAQLGPDPVLLRVDSRAGHGQGKPVAMQIDEAADRWAFVLGSLGMVGGSR